MSKRKNFIYGQENSFVVPWGLSLGDFYNEQKHRHEINNALMLRKMKKMRNYVHQIFVEF